MTKLTETVTVTRQVPMHIADLVRFAQEVIKSCGVECPDAREFWERQHGE